MNSTTAVIVLGAAGVGKSTFINQCTGKSTANVSSDPFKDGTESVEKHRHGGYTYYDTVGLDSKNHSSSTGQLSNALKEDKVTKAAIVLVCNPNARRLTTWFHAFVSTVTTLFKTTDVIVYWPQSHTGFQPPNIQNELKGAIRCSDCLTLDEVKKKLSTSDSRLRTPADSTGNIQQAKPKAKKAKAKKSLCDVVVRDLYGTESSKGISHVKGAINKTIESRTGQHPELGAFSIAKFCGDRLIYVLRAINEVNKKTNDVEKAVTNACTNTKLSEVYDSFGKSNLLQENEAEHSKADIIEATAWHLFRGRSKADKKAFCFLIHRILT